MRLGAFEVTGSLATGGMAEILTARDANGRDVVVKRVLPHLRDDPEIAALFDAEVALVRSLSHPNLVETIADGRGDDGYAYLVMERLEGAPLAGQEVSRERGVEIVSDVLAALEYVHARGVVHRDVAPDNIFITRAGVTKLLDFGVARGAGGKSAYRSPEQTRGDAVDARSDLFSVGVVLWEVTTGERLYRRDNEVATLRAIVETDAPSPAIGRTDYPPALAAIVLRALARDPAARFQSAHDFRAALRQAG